MIYFLRVNRPFSLDVVVSVMLTTWGSFTLTTSECHLMQSEGDLALITARPSKSLRVTNLSDQMADSPCKPLQPVSTHSLESHDLSRSLTSF